MDNQATRTTLRTQDMEGRITKQISATQNTKNHGNIEVTNVFINILVLKTCFTLPGKDVYVG